MVWFIKSESLHVQRFGSWVEYTNQERYFCNKELQKNVWSGGGGGGGGVGELGWFGEDEWFLFQFEWSEIEWFSRAELRSLNF